MPPSGRRIRPTRAVVLVAAAVLSGCDAIAPSPAATTLPPEVPAIRFASDHLYSVDGGRWTFYANVDPGGSPTLVVLETGSGTEEAPVFDGSIPVEDGMLSAGQVSAVVEYPEGTGFCVRFSARNAIGSASTKPYCARLPDLPARTISPSG